MPSRTAASQPTASSVDGGSAPAGVPVGHIDDEPVAEALKALHRRCADVRYLGSWPTQSAKNR
ncbi:hypothetical protein MAHJHV59_50490 [Mycobacterium avium subsp. hominissuis]